MDLIVSELIAQWGAFGAVLCGAGYLIYDNIRNRKVKDKQDSGINSKLNTIIDDVIQIKTEIPTLQKNIKIVEKEVGIVNEKFDAKIEFFDGKLSTRIDMIEEKIDNQVDQLLANIELKTADDLDKHIEQIHSIIEIGPKLHDAMGVYIKRIKCDHMFIGSFHNGTTSLVGIPYYKFDIVAEKFHPCKNEQDCEFAHMYKDVDILRHDKLPAVLFQNELVHYIINVDEESDLSDIDNMLYRRCIGREIKQLAVHMLRDVTTNKPLGFVGVVKYDYDDINVNELKNCAKDIENIYINTDEC